MLVDLEDARINKAIDDYAADPGVEPEHYSFRSWAQIQDCRREDALAEVLAIQRDGGATFFRVTELEDGVWVEGWSEQPRKQAAFNPPYALAEMFA